MRGQWKCCIECQRVPLSRNSKSPFCSAQCERDWKASEAEYQREMENVFDEADAYVGCGDPRW